MLTTLANYQTCVRFKKAIGRTYTVIYLVNSCQFGAPPVDTRPAANVRFRFSLYTGLILNNKPIMHSQE